MGIRQSDWTSPQKSVTFSTHPSDTDELGSERGTLRRQRVHNFGNHEIRQEIESRTGSNQGAGRVSLYALSFQAGSVLQELAPVEHIRGLRSLGTPPVIRHQFLKLDSEKELPVDHGEMDGKGHRRNPDHP